MSDARRVGRRGPKLRLSPVLIVLLLLSPVPSAAQGVEEVAAKCATANAALRPWCREVALGVQAIQGGVGLLASLGSEIPGTASTLGRRFGETPRVSLSGQFGVVRVAFPRLKRGGGGTAEEGATLISGLRLSVSAGLLRGFSPSPTVGGFLSLDLVGSAEWLLLPSSKGFTEWAKGYGYGARVGIVRESFTLPGISLSLVRRDSGRILFGAIARGDDGEFEIDPVTSSLRATAGKDVFGLGVMVGAGLDWNGGSISIVVDDPSISGAGGKGSATLADFENRREVFFAGVGLSLLVLQISAEGGWATGYDLPSWRPAGGYDPSSPTLFGNISVRLIF